MPQGDLVTASEAAAILGWSKAKVNRHAKAGMLRIAHKLPGDLGANLFDRSYIEGRADAAEQSKAAS